VERLLAARLRLAEHAHEGSLEEVLRLTLDEAERLTGGQIGFFHFLGDDGVTLQSWSSNTLAGMAAHDLRNPLTAVHAFAALLEETGLGPVSERQREVLRRIRSTSEHMLELVNDLLDVAKIEAGRLELRREPQDLAAVVREVVTTCQLLASPKGITLEVAAVDELPTACFDRARIDQVLSNLLDNAIKYSPRGSRVRITVERRDGEALISVQDQGRGIAPERIGQLFQAFSTDGEKGTGGEKATGLGLAIARRMIEAHGGRIRVASELGAGSLFQVALPLDEPASIFHHPAGRGDADRVKPNRG
jgi:signal transduction histidine kinase